MKKYLFILIFITICFFCFSQEIIESNTVIIQWDDVTTDTSNVPIPEEAWKDYKVSVYDHEIGIDSISTQGWTTKTEYEITFETTGTWVICIEARTIYNDETKYSGMALSVNEDDVSGSPFVIESLIVIIIDNPNKPKGIKIKD